MIRSEKDSSHVLNVWIKSQPLRSKKGGNRSELKIAQHSKVGKFPFVTFKGNFSLSEKTMMFTSGRSGQMTNKERVAPSVSQPGYYQYGQAPPPCLPNPIRFGEDDVFSSFSSYKNLQGQGIVFPQLTKSTSKNLNYLSFTPSIYNCQLSTE